MILNRKNHQDICIPVTDGAGNVVDLTGFTTATFTLSRKRGMPALVTKTLGDGTAITDAAGGIVTVSLDAADTDRISTFYYELLCIDAASNRTTTASGYLTIQDTTQ